MVFWLFCIWLHIIITAKPLWPKLFRLPWKNCFANSFLIYSILIFALLCLKFNRLLSKGFFDFLSWFCVKYNVNISWENAAFKWRVTRDKVAKNTIPPCHQLWRVATLSLGWRVCGDSRRFGSGQVPPSPSFLSHGLGMRIGQEKNKSILPFYCHFNYNPHSFDCLRYVFLLIFLFNFSPWNLIWFGFYIKCGPHFFS